MKKKPALTPYIRRIDGTGSTEEIAIICRGTGIGDTVHEMPALYERAKGCRLTYIGPRQRRFMIEPMGIRYIALESISRNWIEEHKHEYGTIYDTFGWALVP